MSEPTAFGAEVVGQLSDRSGGPEDPQDKERVRSLTRDAWDDLRRSWIFWSAFALMFFFVTMALFPGLFTDKSPTDCDAARSVQPPSADAWFGYDLQGCDVYARSVYGARASIAVGLLSTFVALVIGAGIGIMAGYFGGLLDSILSRVTDIFFAIPVLLGSIIILTSFPVTQTTSTNLEITKVAIAVAVLGWTITARLARSSVIQVKNADFVLAARSLGAGNWRIIRSHVLPNALGPIIVITTISLGAFIGAEATLSYLGIGLQPPTVSWGVQINDGQEYIQTYPFLVLFPAIFLSLTVLAFIMFGEALREALDPKLK